MKNQFQSTEVLQIRLAPFVDRLMGTYIVSGLDVCSLTIRKPDGSTLSPTAVWDPVTLVWCYDVALLSYQAGEWRVRAESSDPSALPQWCILAWGDYVDNLNGSLADVAAKVDVLYQVTTGRWKVDTATNQLILYATGDAVPLLTFDLKDAGGLPTSSSVYERIRV